ncbi:MAG: OmpA family protein [Saprospiraceae bacterium]|nr:OmpA family protein [Saprospiraceae bacterium]
MANILDDLKGMVTNQIISSAASHLGESEGGISKAIGALLPTLLGGLVSKSTDSSGFSGIFNMLSDNRNAGFLDNLGGLIGGGNLAHGDPKDIAGSLMGNLFGGKVGGILDLVSSFAGVKKSSTSSLLGLAGPLLMGYFSRKIKNEGLNASGLASLLGSQKSSIMSALPAGMGSLLGFGSGISTPSASMPEAPSTGGMNWWPWLIGLLGIAALVYFWKGCKGEVKEAVENTTEVVENAVDSTGAAVSNAAETVTDAASDLGALFRKKLACGVELNIPEKGMENNLVAFIDDKAKPVDKTTWFSFDRLTFQTGSAQLDMTKSAEQLGNIAEILKCYPNVKLKVGGYTDNVGNKESNMKLSMERATAVKATLVALGIEPTRLDAEGYGDQHPVAPNDTEENKAKNRRIDVRVTAK